MNKSRWHRYSPARLRAAIWTIRARIRSRRVVWQEGIAAPVSLPPAPRVSLEGTGAVISVLGRTRSTCLVRAIVLQRWFLDHGEPVDVVIGVTPPSSGFKAHAWLDRPGEEGPERYAEIYRVPPPDHEP